MSKRKQTFKFFDSLELAMVFVKKHRLRKYSTTPWESVDRCEQKIVLWYNQ